MKEVRAAAGRFTGAGTDACGLGAGAGTSGGIHWVEAIFVVR